MAGLSAAYWFALLGHPVTVVERADGLRPGGAPIDVRGRALGTAERMGDRLQVLRQVVVAP
jgi:2-polyprenyl-6-methoxyphenol hydroxylase-like FAD-dependent oxidoreductase